MIFRFDDVGVKCTDEFIREIYSKLQAPMIQNKKNCETNFKFS